MPGVYSVRGFSAASASGAGEPIAAVWNPDSTNRIKLVEFGFYKTGQTFTRYRLARITTRGTPGVTATPDGNNAWANDGEIPPSGTVLDMALYTVNPTVGSSLWSDAHTGGSGGGGTGYVWTFDAGGGLTINPGTGVCMLALAAGIMPISEFYAVWAEE